MQAATPWIDGEKIPDEQIRTIFRRPPDVRLPFFRSTLVIGSRGAGKTTLLRYQKISHEAEEGIAAYVSLATEFGSLTKQTALGPLSYDLPETLEQQLIGKATALLAISIASRLARKGVNVPTDMLSRCIPSTLVRPSGRSYGLAELQAIQQAVASAKIENFERTAELQLLPDTFASFGEATRKQFGPLLILLDRADMVAPATLVPVLQILDQSASYVAVVAMRPGAGGQGLRNVDTIVPGDHYALEYLGTKPRSREWMEFVEAAVEAQLGTKFQQIERPLRSQVVALSRDSLRIALELFARYLASDMAKASDELYATVDELRENHLAAAQQTLQRYHPNFRALVNELRQKTLDQLGNISGPVVLSIQRDIPTDLFERPTRLSRFLQASLRAGVFCVPEGTRWGPEITPSEVEMLPILLWEKGSQMWTCENSTPLRLEIPEKDLFGTQGGQKKAPTVFVAYRMGVGESKDFRIALEDAVRSHHDLSKLVVVDGKVPDGAKWAEIIRERIDKARAVVGDVTGMSPEVLFELGFAYGLKKTIIPITSGTNDISALPRWLSATQLGSYASKTGINRILSSLIAHLTDPEFSKVPRPPQPVTALAVWLRTLSWNQESLAQFQSTTDRYGLKVEIISEITSEETLIKRAGSASLLIVSLDGTKDDAFVHFVCGAVAARPKAGAGKGFQRTILILQASSAGGVRLVADSLTRCPDIVKVIGSEDVIREIHAFGKRYAKWAEAPAGAK